MTGRFSQIWWILGAAIFPFLVNGGCDEEELEVTGPAVEKASAQPRPARQAHAGTERLQRLARQQPLMGTRFEIQIADVPPAESAAASRAIDAAFAEIARVEAKISNWRPSSEISRVNRRAGQGPTPVGEALFEVVTAAHRISEQSDGAFDLTFAGCAGLWSIRERRVPAPSAIERCRPRIDHSDVVLDAERRTIALRHSETRIGVGGIGKGYGVDRAAAVLEARGFDTWLVDGGGDVRVSGAPDGRRWQVGVADPRAPERLVGNVHLSDGAIVTSGDYERYFERGDERYHHILDPKTVRPARESIAVSLIAPTATEADALSTAVFVMGPDRGLALVESLPDVEAMVTGPDRRQHRSSGFDAHFSRREARR